MCGSDLERGFDSSFMDAFDQDVGAVVSGSQDTAIETEVLDETSDNLSDSNSGSSVFTSNDSNGYYNSGMAEFNQNSTLDDVKSEPPVEPMSAPVQTNTITGYVDNNIKYKNTESLSDKLKKKNISMSFIFNTCCFVLFIIIIVFVYFKFLRTPSNENVKLGGLHYTIDEKFNLKSEDSLSKSYEYNSSCYITLSYGVNITDSSYIDKYYDDIQGTFESTESGAAVSNDTMTINGNVWTTLNVAYIVNDPYSQEGKKIVVKYRYLSILHNANIYHIVYANETGADECATMLNDLVTTLSFD